MFHIFTIHARTQGQTKEETKSCHIIKSRLRLGTKKDVIKQSYIRKRNGSFEQTITTLKDMELKLSQ